MNPLDLGGALDTRRTHAHSAHPPTQPHKASPFDEASPCGKIDGVSDSPHHDWHHAWIDLGGEG